MKFYQRFLIGLGLTMAAFILAFGFWYFNAGMFDDIIFFNKPKAKPAPGEVKGDIFENNPLRLEIKFNQAEDINEISYLPENKDIEPSYALGLAMEAKTLDIPFTPQAPYAEWSNPIYQDGCEEAAVLMVMYWVRGEELSKIEANKKIVDLANWQIENYGEFRDTSVQDTVERIFKAYFGYEQVEVKKNISFEDIINELSKANAIIVPTNGRALNNPYYTPPGPARHNLVIRGYDDETGEFITNDPGTRRGELYRYDKDVLFNAIQDYPTGYHLAIERVEKNMIVINKQ